MFSVDEGKGALTPLAPLYVLTTRPLTKMMLEQLYSGPPQYRPSVHRLPPIPPPLTKVPRSPVLGGTTVKHFKKQSESECY